MSIKMTPEQVFQFTTNLCRIGASVPPLPTAKRSKIILYEIYWWLCFSLAWSITIAVMYDLYLNRGNINNVVLNTAELCPLFTTIWKLFLGKHNGQIMQACISEVKGFLRTMDLREREMIQSYIDKSLGLHYILLGCVVSSCVGFSCSPLLLPQPYPARTSYPFEVNSDLLKNTLRLTQMLAIVLTSFGVGFDLQFASFIWIAGARYEILSDELRRVSNRDELCACIQKHQRIIKFAETVNLVTRLAAYGVALSTCFGTVCACAQLLQDISTIMKIRFVTFVGVGLLELLVYSWPAENLTATSEAIGMSIYSSQWFDKSPDIKKLVLIIMQRAKRPSIISIGKFLPILSLNFYGSFLSTVFSYFTTLRATTQESSFSA